MLSIVAAYLTFVAVGTAVMSSLPGPGFKFYGLSFAYNIVQVMLCAYMCIEAFILAQRNGYTLTPCNAFDVRLPPLPPCRLSRRPPSHAPWARVTEARPARHRRSAGAAARALTRKSISPSH